MKLTRASDGDVSGWTGLDREATVTVEGSPLLLSPSNGVDLSSIARTAGWGTDNLEITVVKFDDYMTKIDLLDGFWDASEFLLFQYDWATPANAIIPWLGGTFGTVKSKLGRTVIELHCHRRWLQQDTTPITQPNCWYEFGDPNTCRVDLAPHTYAGTVTTAGQRTFTASALAPAAGTFDEGKLTWLTGPNAGRVRKVRTHAGGGVLTLWEPMLLTVDVGDTFTVIAGCPRTRAACITFGNILNYPGFDQKPTADQVTGGAVVEP
jgi:uncharacterized phage protein (TIGR02218 family)